MLWWTIRQLKADDWKVREAAAKKLGELEDVRSIEALVAALKDTNSRVRQATVGALVKIGNPAVRMLITALKSKSADARRAAAAALVKIGGPAVTPLGAAFYERDLTVREIAATVLGEIGNVSAMEQLLSALEHGDSGAKEAAAAGLVRIGPKAIQPLIAKLRDHKVRVRETAAAALVRIGRAAIEPLVAAVNDDQIREAVIEILWKIDPNWAQSVAAKDAIAAITKTLKEGDDRVRRTAATVLGQLGDARVLDVLVAALRDPNTGVQEAAAIALGEVGDPRALVPLVSALRHGDTKARKAVSAGIVQISNAIVQPLVEALKSKDTAVREAVAAVLVRIGHSVVEPLVDALWKIDPDWSKTEGAKTVLPQFVSALEDAGGKLSQDYKEALRKARNTPVIKPLAATFKDIQNGLGKASMAVGQIKNSREVETFSQALDNSDSASRKSALDALLEISKGSEEPLAAALSSKNHVIRRAAAHAMAEHRDPRACEVLRCDLIDSSKLVMLDAAESLLKIGDVGIVQPLLKQWRQLADSQTGELKTTCAHTSKRVARLLRSLLEEHGKNLDLEDLEALSGFQTSEGDRFVPSASLRNQESVKDDTQESPAMANGLAGWLEIKELARRELSRRRSKA